MHLVPFYLDWEKSHAHLAFTFIEGKMGKSDVVMPPTTREEGVKRKEEKPNISTTPSFPLVRQSWKMHQNDCTAQSMLAIGH
jgi:hypothetical protein